MKLEIDGMEGKEVKSDFTLAAYRSTDDPESTSSLIAGSYDDIGDIMTLLQCCSVTAVHAALNLDALETEMVANPKMLLNTIETFNVLFNKLKANVFAELFDDILKDTIDNNKSDIDFAIGLAKLLPRINNDIKVQAYKIGKEEIENLKKQAVEALGVESTDDIQVDVQELLRQLGKDLDNNENTHSST